MLCYLFDNNELTNDELKKIKEESAQYSLHVVGLVINSNNKFTCSRITSEAF